VTSEEQFLAHLPLLDRVVAFIAHRYGMADGDREEFASHVRLKCIEDDYRIFREFGERSSSISFSTIATLSGGNGARRPTPCGWDRWRSGSTS
jgi:hypothetical protein